jgi:hypothetical protein
MASCGSSRLALGCGTHDGRVGVRLGVVPVRVSRASGSRHSGHGRSGGTIVGTLSRLGRLGGFEIVYRHCAHRDERSEWSTPMVVLN